MASYAEKLRALFPDYADRDWTLSCHDGVTVMIEKWNRVEPQPTDLQINAVTDVQVDAAQKNKKSDEGITKLDDLAKAMLAVMASHLGMTPQSLRQEVRQELKK